MQVALLSNYMVDIEWLLGGKAVTDLLFLYSNLKNPHTTDCFYIFVAICTVIVLLVYIFNIQVAWSHQLKLCPWSHFADIYDSVPQLFVTCTHLWKLSTACPRLRTVPSVVVIHGESGGSLELLQVHSHMHLHIVTRNLSKLLKYTILVYLNQYRIPLSLM